MSDMLLNDAENHDSELTALHPNYKTMARVAGILVMVPFVIGALAFEAAELLPRGVTAIPLVLLLVWLVIYLPMRRYQTRGYDMADDRLRVVKGVLFHADTVVPFSRVQHLDVEQGPLERAFGIARLILHTAGSHNASVTLPGLWHADAVAMREEIRAHVKRETQ